MTGQIICDIYGCRRVRNTATDPNVTLTIDNETKNLKLCDYHFEMLEVMDPALYSIGYTYTGEPEIRLHPATPTPPPV